MFRSFALPECGCDRAAVTSAGAGVFSWLKYKDETGNGGKKRKNEGPA